MHALYENATLQTLLDTIEGCLLDRCSRASTGNVLTSLLVYASCRHLEHTHPLSELRRFNSQSLSRYMLNQLHDNQGVFQSAPCFRYMQRNADFSSPVIDVDLARAAVVEACVNERYALAHDVVLARATDKDTALALVEYVIIHSAGRAYSLDFKRLLCALLVRGNITLADLDSKQRSDVLRWSGFKGYKPRAQHKLNYVAIFESFLECALGSFDTTDGAAATFFVDQLEAIVEHNHAAMRKHRERAETVGALLEQIRKSIGPKRAAPRDQEPESETDTETTLQCAKRQTLAPIDCYAAVAVVPLCDQMQQS
jgi:hypothetical protein